MVKKSVTVSLISLFVTLQQISAKTNFLRDHLFWLVFGEFHFTRIFKSLYTQQSARFYLLVCQLSGFLILFKDTPHSMP